MLVLVVLVLVVLVVLGLVVMIVLVMIVSQNFPKTLKPHKQQKITG